MTSQTEISNHVPFSQFPKDKKEDMQVKIKDFSKNSDGKTIAYNINNSECFKNSEVVEIPQNDFNFYMSIFEKFEKDKEKRAQIQRNYFLNNKKSYYQRQKKWRDGHKLELNKKRREKYALKKINSHDIGGGVVASPSESIQVESVEILETVEAVEALEL